MCMFCRISLFVLLYFFLLSMCCLFFFDLRILTTPLVSSNSSSCIYVSRSYFCLRRRCVLDSPPMTVCVYILYVYKENKNKNESIESVLKSNRTIMLMVNETKKTYCTYNIEKSTIFTSAVFNEQK
jgi:hypothetical protein